VVDTVAVAAIVMVVILMDLLRITVGVVVVQQVEMRVPHMVEVEVDQEHMQVPVSPLKVILRVLE
jgi:hypothetical protein